MLPNLIRWRLPLSYAAIALVAVLSLGLVLLTILRGFYVQQELSYLADNAQVISLELTRLVEADLPEAALQAQLQNFAFLTQTRVRLFDPDGNITADSGEPYDQRQVFAISVEIENEQVITQTTTSPQIISIQAITETVPIASDVTQYAPFIYLKTPGGITADQIQSRTVIVRREVSEGLFNEEIEQEIWVEETVLENEKQPSIITETHEFVVKDLPSYKPDSPPTDGLLESFDFVSALPANRTPYGFSLSADRAIDGRRTDQIMTQALYDAEGNLLGQVELSQGPAYGREILESVAWGWVIAGGMAVLVAAAAGWLISRQISTPLLALTQATDRMAEGDLSVRADVTRQDELGTLAGAFNEMATQVEGTVSALQRFVADAAHELHTPLTALRTNLELAAAPEQADRQAFLAQAQSQVERLESLTNSLLALSRLESQQAGAPDYSPLDLYQLVLEASERYASQAEQAGLDFLIELESSPVRVNGNAGQLRRVLDNLLSNALKFTPTGGQVKLGLNYNLEDQYVTVWVEDTGIGIPDEDLPQLFNRFRRGRNATAYPGNGLGLALVRAIIEGHNGQVQAKNTQSGTCFSFRLPVEVD